MPNPSDEPTRPGSYDIGAPDALTRMDAQASEVSKLAHKLDDHRWGNFASIMHKYVKARREQQEGLEGDFRAHAMPRYLAYDAREVTRGVDAIFGRYYARCGVQTEYDQADRNAVPPPMATTDPEATLAMDGHEVVAMDAMNAHGGLGSIVLDLHHHRQRLSVKQARELYEALRAVVSRPETPAARRFAMSPEGEKVWNEQVALNEYHPYSRAILDFAEIWAVEMQQRLGAVMGATVADIADDALKVADADPRLMGGVTGYQYGQAVSILAQAWQHGEDLRRWHNTKHQICTEGDQANREGGVLNPAVLQVGAGDGK